MKLRYLLLAFTMILLGACESPEQTTQDIAPAESAKDAEEALTEDTVAEIEALNIAGVTEDSESDASDEEQIVLGESGITAAQQESDWKYKEGEYFRRMTTSQGTSSAPDKIEVAEVFWYGCAHCYNFDPVLQKWKQNLAADVTFVRIPVIWNPTNQIHARIMYTAEALGKLDEAHEGIFKAIHQEGNMLTSEDELVQFFGRYGVSKTEFLDAYNSFGVSSSVKRAENLTRRYGIRSVPVIVVNGKYVTDAPGVRSFDDMIGVTNELVERERSGR